MILEERKKEFYDAIKEKVGEKLTDEQIRGIVEKFNLENGNIPQIITTTNPYDFEKSSRRNKDIFEHSWAGSRKDITETDVLIGDYKPGIDDIYEYSENGNTSEPQESHEMSDFSINQVQVAVVMKSTIDDFNGNNIDEYNESVQIYLPEEKEYPENVSFKQMVLEERKTKFYKANSTRRGSGIGLALANEIVMMHGGELLIDSKENVGTTVTVVLPVNLNTNENKQSAVAANQRKDQPSNEE